MFKNKLSCRFTTSERWLASSISLFTQVEASGDENKGAASPPRGGGLQAQFISLPGLRPQLKRIKLLLHHLRPEVACELNFALYPS